MIKLLTVVGARPQFIKSAAFSRAIASKFSHVLNETIVHTGQHYDANMSDIFFNELNIPKEKYNLNVNPANHAFQTAQIMMGFDGIAETEKPDAIVLYGDTNSTLAACLVGVKRHIPVIHIEAGVRSYNKTFPEEVNRLICDHVSSILFVPSDAGMSALEQEGFIFDREISEDGLLLNSPKVFRCGDIMYDNTLFFKNKADHFFQKLSKQHNLPQKDFFLVTAHRPSNVDNLNDFKEIVKFFHYSIDVLKKEIVFPIHPRTQNLVNQNPELSEMINKKGIYCIPPVSFIDMIALEKYADIVITDSGGVQKEAFFMEKPCLIMLEETPWVELVESNNAKLVGNNFNLLCNGAKEFLENKPVHFPQLYGDGNSAEFICEKITQILSL